MGLEYRICGVAYAIALKSIVIGLLLGLFVPSALWAQSALDNPPNGSTVSGISIISGWKCTAGSITFTIDNGPPGQLVHGVSRGDTAGVCKNDGENGFIAQFNWNLVGAGQHTIRVFDGGAKFAETIFNVVTYGTQFLSGATGAYVLPAFPQADTNTIVQWQESIQNFSIVGVQPSSGIPPGAYSVSGTETHSLCFNSNDNGSSEYSGYLSGDGANSAFFTGAFSFPGGLSISATFNGQRSLFGNAVNGNFSFAYYSDGVFITTASGLFQGTATGTEVNLSYNGLAPQFGCLINGSLQATR